MKHYSMGCLADSIKCSVCGETFTQGPLCEHLNAKLPRIPTSADKDYEFYMLSWDPQEEKK